MGQKQNKKNLSLRLTCQRCGHRWLPRKPQVKTCPKCRSKDWDKPKEKT